MHNHRQDNSCSYLPFFLLGMPNSLRIHGYLIKYPWIFYYVSVDISSRIRGYVSFLLCPHGLLSICSRLFPYMLYKNFFCDLYICSCIADLDDMKREGAATLQPSYQVKISEINNQPNTGCFVNDSNNLNFLYSCTCPIDYHL